MKMKYEKPAVAVERYDLTQTIAACGIKIGLQTSTCVKNDFDANNALREYAAGGGFVSFPGCIVFASSGDTFDGICYHTSAGYTSTSVGGYFSS